MKNQDFLTDDCKKDKELFNSYVKKYNINWYNNFRLYKEILNYFYYFNASL